MVLNKYSKCQNPVLNFISNMFSPQKYFSGDNMDDVLEFQKHFGMFSTNVMLLRGEHELNYTPLFVDKIKSYNLGYGKAKLDGVDVSLNPMMYSYKNLKTIEFASNSKIVKDVIFLKMGDMPFLDSLGYNAEELKVGYINREVYIGDKLSDDVTEKGYLEKHLDLMKDGVGSHSSLEYNSLLMRLNMNNNIVRSNEDSLKGLSSNSSSRKRYSRLLRSF